MEDRSRRLQEIDRTAGKKDTAEKAKNEFRRKKYEGNELDTKANRLEKRRADYFSEGSETRENIVREKGAEGA